MKRILAVTVASTLLAIPCSFAQTIQELNHPKDSQVEYELQIQQQRQAQALKDNQLFNHVGFGLTAGGDGFGAEVSVTATPLFQIRGGYSFSPSFKKDIDLVSLTGKSVTFTLSNDRTVTIANLPVSLASNLGGPHLLVDFFPGSNTGFHLTAGVYYSLDNQFLKIDLDASNILVESEYGGGVYYQFDKNNRESRISADPQGVLHLNATTSSPLRPYLGLGFGRSVDVQKRVKLVLDLGVLLWGKPQIESVYYGMVDPDSPNKCVDKDGNVYLPVPITGDLIRKIPADDPESLEQAASALESFNNFPVCPILKLGLFFRLF